MEELSSMWRNQEGIELREKLLYATLELESVKQQANQENIKNKENVKNLLNLLQMAYKERDEAKNQLQKLLNKLMISQFNAETPLLILPTNPKSSLTDSNSHSDTNNPQSHASADSFFDTVSSPEFSPLNMADSGRLAGVGNPKMDQNSMVIESIVKGKKLPEKGKLLQAVMEAGPLLQTVLVAGPLPRWRNPPPAQPFKIPAVSIKGCDMMMMMNHEQKPLSSQMCSSTSMLNFSDSCFNSSGFGSQIPAGKRQRFH